MEKRFFDLMNLIIDTVGRGCGSVVVTEKVADDKDFNKGRGANKNPYLDGRLVVRKVYGGVMMGTDYATSVANAVTKVTGNTTTKEDVNLKPVWHIAFPDSEKYLYSQWFEKKRSEAKGEETTAYLKIQRCEEQNSFFSVKTSYYLYGKEVTDEKTIEDIEQWKKGASRTQSSTQTEMGLGKANERYYQCISLANLKMIKQGEKVVNF